MFASSMPLRNRIKEFVDERGITRYQFCKDTGLAENTGYRLYKDPTYIPGAEAMAKICDTYRVQPGDLVRWVPVTDTAYRDSEGQQPRPDRPLTAGGKRR